MTRCRACPSPSTAIMQRVYGASAAPCLPCQFSRKVVRSVYNIRLQLPLLPNRLLCSCFSPDSALCAMRNTVKWHCSLKADGGTCDVLHSEIEQDFEDNPLSRGDERVDARRRIMKGKTRRETKNGGGYSSGKWETGNDAHVAELMASRRWA